MSWLETGRSVSKAVIHTAASAVILTGCAAGGSKGVELPNQPQKTVTSSHRSDPQCQFYALTSEEIERYTNFEFMGGPNDSRSGRFIMNFDIEFLNQHPCFGLSKIFMERDFQLSASFSKDSNSQLSISAYLARTTSIVPLDQITQPLPNIPVLESNELVLRWNNHRYDQIRFNQHVFQIPINVPRPLAGMFRNGYDKPQI